MQRLVPLVLLVAFTFAGCLSPTVNSKPPYSPESNTSIKSDTSDSQPVERSSMAKSSLKQAQPIENKTTENKTTGNKVTETKTAASGQGTSQMRSMASLSGEKRIQPAAKALICAVPTTSALKKDYARKPENCRIVETKHEAQAFDLKCNQFYEISRVFTNGNYSCDVNVVKCVPGAPCDFSEFPCQVGDRQRLDRCSGVKQILLMTSTPNKNVSSR